MSEKIKNVTYHHMLFKGSAYEVGKLQGEIVKNHPETKNFYSSGKGKLTHQNFLKTFKEFEMFSPGLNEELKGFADALDIPVEDIVYYALTNLQPSHCSHFATLSAITKNGHVLVGRSYEFNDTMEDLRLCTTRIQGKYAHIGFSLLLFGRTDGINEHGLSVTMSAAGLPIGNAPGMKPPIESGLHFWVLVRAILEQCQTVEEAIELTQKVPLGCNLNLIVTQKNGSAALIEIVGSHQSVKKITATTKNQSLCATNHLTQPDMIQHIPMMMKNSKVRFDTITSTLKKSAPHITKETIKDLLSNPYPKGLCLHYYKEGFGTLWSMIFDLTEGTVSICFGSSIVNQWHTFQLSESKPTNQYQIKLPQKNTNSDSDFWQQMPIE